MKGGVLLLTGLVFWITAVAQIKVGDQPTSLQKAVALDVQGNSKQGLWLPRVSDTSITGIRAYNPPDGLVLYHTPSGKLLLRSGNAWVTFATAGSAGIQKLTVGTTSLTNSEIFFTVGTSQGTSNDVNIAANNGTNTITLNIPDASTGARGVVTNGAQTFGGVKTFNNNIIANAGISINNGGTVNGGLTVNNGFTTNNGATIYNGASIYGASTIYNGATIHNGLTVAGGTSPATNLTVGLNSSSTPAASTDKYLSVNGSGVVTLNAAPVTTNTTTKMKSYSAQVDGLPITIAASSAQIVTLSVAGANFSTNSTVTVTPRSALQTATKIHWARVTSSTQIEVSIGTGASSQSLVAGGTGNFNITVIEF